MNTSLRLHVNVDHVATLRQARREAFPDPAAWAERALAAGAHGITAHLRKDRRHIQDADVAELRAVTPLFNLESSLDPEMLALATGAKADQVCLVPENRTEITTEGGLDVASEFQRVKSAVERLVDTGAEVSLFVDPDLRQVELAKESGAPAIELHTGSYANAKGTLRETERARIEAAANAARESGLIVHAGHGLDYANVRSIAVIEPIVELNIGFSIVARAVFDGVEHAVLTMLQELEAARG